MTTRRNSKSRLTKQDLLLRLEEMVRERTTELTQVNKALEAEIVERLRIEGVLREKEIRLQQAQDLLEAVTAGTGVIIAAVDTSFRYTFINKAYFEEIKRLSGIEIRVGSSMLDAFAHLPEQQKTVELEWNPALRGESTSKMLEFGDPGRYRRVYSVLHTPIRNSAGKVVGAGEVAYDISEQVQTQQALRESEDRFQLFMDNSPAIAWIKDEQGRHVYHSKTFDHRFSTQTGDWHGKTDFEIWPPETAALFEENDRAVWGAGKPLDVYEETLNPDGSRCTWWTIKFAYQNPEGQRFIGGIGVDISELRSTQQQLQKSLDELDMRVQERTQELARTNDELRGEIAERKWGEAQLRLQTSALKAAVIGILITDKSGKILWANPAFSKMTGYTFEEMYQQNPRFLKSGHHDEAFYNDLWSTILSGQVWYGEMVNRCKDGSLYIEEQSITPVFDENGDISNFIAVKRDITLRRKGEQALENSEKRYRSLVIASTQMVWTTNAMGEVVEDQYAWRDFTGQKEDEILGYGWLNAVHPDDRQRVAAVWTRSVETKAIYDTEYRVRRKDGEYRYMAARGVPVLDKDQRIREWVGTCQDITERIAADKKLKQASAYNRSLIEASLDPLVTITQDGKIGDVNRATELVTGFRRDELIGTDFHEYFTDPDKARAGYQQVFEKGSVRDYALDIQHKDGTITPVLYNASLYRDESGEVIGIFAVARDISERKIAESRLEQSNRDLLALSQLEHNQRQLAETLRLTSLALTQTLSVDAELEILLEYMNRLIPFDSANAALLGGDSCLLARAVYVDNQMELPETDRLIHASEPIPSSFLEIFSTPQSIVLPDLNEPLAWSPLPGIEHIHSWLGIPLVADGKVFGLCSLGKFEPGFYTQEHAQLAEAFVAQASMAVQNAWLFEQVRAGRERLQALSHRLVEVQETERRTIARELHDEAGQALASLIIGLRLLEQEADDPVAATTRVKELRRITESVMEELHRLAINLRPATLDHLGLVAALRQYIETLNERQVMKIQFEAIGFESGRLSPALETSLYRIVQEALANVVLHAQASEIAVILDWRGDCVIVIVEDDGVGFDTEAETGLERMGLAGMRERAEMLEGTLTVESEIGAGTTIHVEVPYGNTNSSS